MNGRLIVFCGLPSSGKTTIAKLVASKLGNVIHIQTDTLRLMFSKPTYTLEESTFVYNAMFLVGKEALKHGYDAILDATFLKEDYRLEAQRKLGRYYSSVWYVCVVCSLPTVLKRNELRGGTGVVPRDTLLRFHRMFEMPKSAIVVNTIWRTPESSAAYIVDQLKKREGSAGIGR
jgi:predicted kinase